eukprot:NODE_12189_length_196_cov_154.938776_g11574_i0.p1 GENE.NODE_12189_length_196_cov_154.938776_g11574_i0~~NODE_12189_length_196_cov_154.938776_g11574_i0.p1  ORF type:complete len:62 (+),score=23.89 NODE_12189_length_196_cov_154.938776_g11574_i0:25-186(+)
MVGALQLPDFGGDKRALGAHGGDVIFAFVLLHRQPNWKAKIGMLDKIMRLSGY